ncbi:shoc2 [Symbiodinium natans]|uniref:Shoc2 protein n=1 Tax=Symbiodinium natans TaxID=878477 RepID=A0A812GVJ9_9DINO|nr:shoc2 [Symbiodinium natans]
MQPLARSLACALIVLSIARAQACATARVVSFGKATRWADGWASFLLSDRPISFFPARGVNLVAINASTEEVIFARSYKKAPDQLKKDLQDVALDTVVLVALKGGADQESLQALSLVHASLFPVLAEGEGYAFIAGRGGVPITEDLGRVADATS